jgi:hypothetical protein
VGGEQRGEGVEGLRARLAVLVPEEPMAQSIVTTVERE